MHSDPYPKFDNNPNTMPRITGSLFHNKDSGKKISSSYKQLDSLQFNFKNLKRSSDKKENDSLLKKFESKEDEIKKIINKFNANIEIKEILNKANEINKSLKENENKIFFNSKILEDNNLNQIRNSLDHIPLEEFQKLSLELEKNKILNESLNEKKAKKKVEEKVGFDINHIHITLDQKKLIIDFLKKYRNIFLLKLNYKNLTEKNKENFINYLNKLISLGNKENNVAQIDFEKLDQQVNKSKHLNSADDLSRLKFINEFVDANITYGNNHNGNLNHSNTFNIINNNNNLLKNPPINYPSNLNITANNSYINPSLFSGVQQSINNNNSNFDLFGNVVPDSNANNNNNNNNNYYHNINNPNSSENKNIDTSDKNPFDDFSLLRGSSSEINENLEALYQQNYQKGDSSNIDKDKRLVRKMLINEFKQAVNRYDFSFDLAENFFFGTGDLKFAVQNYYQNKYEDENLKMTFKFPSGKEYTIVKEFTDSPSSIFDEIMNIIFNKEKKEVFEFKLIQECARGVIDIDSNVKFLGGLNIEKNKIINVKYDIN